MNKDAVIFPEFTPAFLLELEQMDRSLLLFMISVSVVQLVGQEDMKPSEAKSSYFLNVISQNNSRRTPYVLITNPIVEEMIMR